MRVAFVHPHAGNINVGSYRLQTLQPVKYLQSQCMECKIFKTVEEAVGDSADVIVCMQINDVERAVEFRDMQSASFKVVAFQSDNRMNVSALQSSDAIVVDCDLLLTKVPLEFSSTAFHIPTPLELVKNLYTPHLHPGRKLKLGYVGAQGNLFFGYEILEQLRKDYDVTIITDSEYATVPWNVSTYADELNKCDVGIVPYPQNLQVNDARGFDQWFYKDPSRPTLLQAIGLPVIVSPLPSYVTYIMHDRTGLIANGIEQFRNCIDYLQKYENRYNFIADKGWIQSWEYAVPERIGKLWLHLLQGV